MTDLTPQALHALAQRVPVEARPSREFVFYVENGDRPYWCHDDPTTPVDTAHALLLHEAAAMRWLVVREHSLSVYAPGMYDGEDTWTVCLYGVAEATGPTLLHALVTAAMSITPHSTSDPA